MNFGFPLSVLSLALLAVALPHPAFAACSSPAGNAGDVMYSSIQNIMVYCNGNGWIVMGENSPISFGTLTTNDFCTATSGSNLTFGAHV